MKHNALLWRLGSVGTAVAILAGFLAWRSHAGAQGRLGGPISGRSVLPEHASSPSPVLAAVDAPRRRGDDVLAILAKAQTWAAKVGREEARNSEVHRKIVELWVRTGDFPGAIAATEIMPINYNRILALADIALAQLVSGDAVGARVTLDLALVSAHEGREPRYLGLVRDLQRGRTLGVIPAIEGQTDFLSSELSHLSIAYAKAGDVRMALCVIRLIDACHGDSFKVGAKEDAVTGVAELQAQRGDEASALQTLKVLPRSQQPSSLERIAAELATAGKTQAALRIADAIVDPVLRNAVLEEIPRARERRAQNSGFVYTVSDAEPFFVIDPTPAPKGLVQAAKVYGAAAEVEKKGKIPEALALLRRASRIAADVPRPVPKNWRIGLSAYHLGTEAFPYGSKWVILRKIAEAQARLGDNDGVLTTVEAFRKDWGRMATGYLVMAMAAGVVRAGESTGPHDWIDRLDSPMEKGFALAGVAEGLLDRQGGRGD